mgnify:CR=1 FL=1
MWIFTIAFNFIRPGGIGVLKMGSKLLQHGS